MIAVLVEWIGSPEALNVELRDPTGTTVAGQVDFLPADAAGNNKSSLYFWGPMQSPKPGAWRVQLRAPQGVLLPINYSVSLWSKSVIVLEALWQSRSSQLTVPLKARLTQRGTPIPDASVTAQVQRYTALAGERSWSEPISLLDNGSRPDEHVHDGIYTGTLKGERGFYIIHLTGSGRDLQGASFQQQTLQGISFGPPSRIEYQGIGPEAPKDTDGDGLYDLLAVPVHVHVIAQDTFVASAQLVTKPNMVVAGADVKAELPAGDTALWLEFPVDRIVSQRLHGSFAVQELRLAQESSAGWIAPEAQAFPDVVYYAPEAIFRTTIYGWDQFQREPVFPISEVMDRGIDEDGNGRYELLRLQAEVLLTVGGRYRLRGCIQGGNPFKDPEEYRATRRRYGRLVQRGEINPRAPTIGRGWFDWCLPEQSLVLKRGPQAITFDIHGTVIREAQVDGPYQLFDVWLEQVSPRGEVVEVAGRRIQANLVGNGARDQTNPYRWQEFE
ncbi:MAG: hypothetical protein HYZ92_02590 [Candidatus Omnitrophica bacterium]|nr:hypothetical protein [Candidatus Omnitrophota bacterium]